MRSLGIQVSMQLSWGTKNGKSIDYTLGIWGTTALETLKEPHETYFEKAPTENGRLEHMLFFLENLTLPPLGVGSFMDSSVDVMPLKTLRRKCREMHSLETGHSHQFRNHLSQRQGNQRWGRRMGPCINSV